METVVEMVASAGGGGVGGLLAEEGRPAKRAASARDGGELRTFGDDYTGQ